MNYSFRSTPCCSVNLLNFANLLVLRACSWWSTFWKFFSSYSLKSICLALFYVLGGLVISNNFVCLLFFLLFQQDSSNSSSFESSLFCEGITCFSGCFSIYSTHYAFLICYDFYNNLTLIKLPPT